MAAPRRKAIAQEAPSTIDEAVKLLGYYSSILTQTEELRAQADVSIAAIEAQRDTLIAPFDAEAKDVFMRLRAWWAVAGDNMTEGKRKSIELAGCVVGIRTSTPALKLPKGAKGEDLAELLRDDEVGAPYASAKWSLNKPAIIKALRDSSTVAAVTALFAKLKLSVSQKEEFFIDRAGEKPASPEIISVEELAA